MPVLCFGYSLLQRWGDQMNIVVSYDSGADFAPAGFIGDVNARLDSRPAPVTLAAEKPEPWDRRVRFM
jgi:hypothetical protein